MMWLPYKCGPIPMWGCSTQVRRKRGVQALRSVMRQQKYLWYEIGQFSFPLPFLFACLFAKGINSGMSLHVSELEPPSTGK